jgi:ribose transport system substrate-binding protein
MGALAAAGCSQGSKTSDTSTTGSTAPAAATTYSVAFVTNNSSNYWLDAKRGTEEAMKEMPNVNVQFIMPSDGAAATQRTNVDDMMAKGVQGIAISPVDPKNEVDLLNGVASKAALITQDSDAPTSNRLCYIGTDNVAAGGMVGDLIKKSLPGGGKIMLFVGKRDAQNAKEREQGIRDTLKGTNISIIDVRTDDADHARAKANAADALVSHPEVAELVGLWSYNGPAILSAVQDAHKIGQVKIVCFDTDPGTLPGIKSGAIYGTVVQQPFQFALQSVKYLVQTIKGDKSWIPANKQILVPTAEVTKDNVDKYLTPAS